MRVGARADGTRRKIFRGAPAFSDKLAGAADGNYLPINYSEPQIIIMDCNKLILCTFISFFYKCVLKESLNHFLQARLASIWIDVCHARPKANYAGSCFRRTKHGRLHI